MLLISIAFYGESKKYTKTEHKKHEIKDICQQ